ncbi:MAG TPA: BBP7 family outer membrane beta-barrel protein, partial [Urbifossiella sp.]|nr:BBP7 family outer membrane beta-barrel protein [Urbifossiella sp.]
MRRIALFAAAVVLTAAGRSPAADLSPLFTTPLPGGPGTTLPGSGPLAAPVITPAGTTSHGRQLFEMTPAGWEKEPFFTRDPARYTTTAGDNPVACSSAGWVSFDFLLWATQGPAAPPVVTTGPSALGAGLAAIPGTPGAVPLFGGSRVLNDMRPGFRLDFFLPVAADGSWGFGTRFEMLGQSADSFAAVGTGMNVINVPQVAAVGGVPVPVPVYVGFPGLALGTVTASTQTDYLGADHHFRHVLAAGDAVRLDGILGYRFAHLGDRLQSSWDVFSPTAPPPAGPRLMGDDSIRTRNDFHGGMLGLGSSARFGRFSVSGRMTVALGATIIEQDQSRTRVAVPGLAAGGL